MNSVRTPEEQAKFEELQTYFRFQGRREYLRVQGSFLNSALMFLIRKILQPDANIVQNVVCRQ